MNKLKYLLAFEIIKIVIAFLNLMFLVEARKK